MDGTVQKVKVVLQDSVFVDVAERDLHSTVVTAVNLTLSQLEEAIGVVVGEVADHLPVLSAVVNEKWLEVEGREDGRRHLCVNVSVSVIAA